MSTRVIALPEPEPESVPQWWDAGDAACPEGAKIDGKAPPEGDEIWCALPDGTKHGMWTWFYELDHKLSEGAYERDLPVGLWTTWYPNGNVKLQGHYVGGKEDGVWYGWHANGQPATLLGMQGGVKHGRWVWWYETGIVAGEGAFAGGKPDGRWIRYNASGQIAKVEEYEDDVLVFAVHYRDGKPVRELQAGRDPGREL
jgi:antitoxin component YwqK of YwqJK toxin-antitoxin module